MDPIRTHLQFLHGKDLDSRTANCVKLWALRLIAFDLEIGYIRTENFGKADALSRFIHEARQDSSDSDLEEVVALLQEEKAEFLQIVQKTTQYLFFHNIYLN